MSVSMPFQLLVSCLLLMVRLTHSTESPTSISTVHPSSKPSTSITSSLTDIQSTVHVSNDTTNSNETLFNIPMTTIYNVLFGLMLILVVLCLGCVVNCSFLGYRYYRLQTKKQQIKETDHDDNSSFYDTTTSSRFSSDFNTETPQTTSSGHTKVPSLSDDDLNHVTSSSGLSSASTLSTVTTVSNMVKDGNISNTSLTQNMDHTILMINQIPIIIDAKTIPMKKINKKQKKNRKKPLQTMDLCGDDDEMEMEIITQIIKEQEGKQDSNHTYTDSIKSITTVSTFPTIPDSRKYKDQIAVNMLNEYDINKNQKIRTNSSARGTIDDMDREPSLNTCNISP